ncbi:DinB family protein [Streptomyces capparidis]
MTHDTGPGTTVHEPSPTAGEAETLLFALDRSRAQFAWKCGGLNTADLNRPHPPSTLTLGGLLKHMALVEERCTIDFTGEAPGPPLDVPGAASDPEWAWRTAAEDTPEELHDLWRRAAERSRAAMAKALAAGGLDQPAQYTTTADGTSPNLRRVMVDLRDEYARHVGHADLLREAIDGLVGEDPPR